MLVQVQLDGVERAYDVAGFEDLVREGRVGPETPVRSPALTGDRWVAARTLPVWAALAEGPAAFLARAWERPAVPWATALVVGVNLRVFLWLWGSAPGLEIAERFHRHTPAVVERAESYRFLTYGFLHASPGHILNNLLFLALVGVALETVVGGPAVLALFAVSVVAGGALSGAMAPETPSVGASGGDFGFLAAAAVFGARFLDLVPARRRGVFGGFLAALGLWAFVNGLRSEGVDNWGHAGGLAAGLAFGALLRPADARGRAWNRRVAVAALGAVAVFLAAVAAAGPRLLPLTPEAEDGVTVERPTWWRPGWAGNADGAWVSPMGEGALAARTVARGAPAALPASVDEYLATWTAVDPQARVVERGPVERDGVAGERLVVAWTRRGTPMRTDAEVYARGRYLTTVAADVPADADRLRARLDQARASAALTTPDALREALSGEGGLPRVRSARAEARAALGDLDGARAEFAAAMTAAPRDARIREAWVTTLAAWATDDAAAEAEAALAAFPEDRKLRAAVARALADLGRVDRARAVLDEGLALAPGDRTLGRVRAELDELPAAP